MKVLVIGQGGMGRLYCQALREAGALAGVLVRTAATVERLRSQLAEPIGTNLEEMLAATGADALAILPTTDWHAHYLREAIARGLPALVIKPSCTNADTAEALDAQAKAAKVPVLVAHEGVFQPAFVTLEAAIAEGRIGAVREVQWLKEGAEQLSGGRQKDAARPEDLDGTNYGFIYATTMHELYACNRLAGRQAPERAEVVSVFASATQPRLDARIDYPGLVARLRYNAAPNLPFRRGLNVVGERGSALWLMEPGKTTLRVKTARETRDLPYHGFSGANPATPVVAAWLQSLAAGAAPTEGLLDGARALRAARMVTKAAAERQGAEIDLDAIAGGKDM